MKESRLPIRFVAIGWFLTVLMVVPGTAVLSAGVGGDASKRPALQLDYIANEGVMLTAGENKILIDALFDKENPNYRAPSADILKKMVEGQSHFDGADLILFTHGHADHFDASVVAQVMENRPEPRLILPADVLPDLKAAVKDWEKIKSRVFPVDLKIGENIRKTFGGITVDAFRTKHSGNREIPNNLIYVIEMGGWRMIHEGDSYGDPETYRRFGLGKKHIDLALVHFWFPLSPNGVIILQELLVPDHIGLFHLPKKLEGDAPSKIDRVKKFYQDIFLLLPDSKSRIFD